MSSPLTKITQESQHQFFFLSLCQVTHVCPGVIATERVAPGKDEGKVQRLGMEMPARGPSPVVEGSDGISVVMERLVGALKRKKGYNTWYITQVK